MSSVREKLINYLAAGVSQSAAAEAVGVTPSYVSQLLEEDGVRGEIAGVRGETLNKQLKQDELVEQGEKAALEKMIAMLPYSRSLSETTKAFATLNAAKRKSIEALGRDNNNSGIAVTIVMPQAASVMMQVNVDNQVVEIAGKSIAPLPSAQLPGLAARLKERLEGTVAVPPLPAPEPKPHVVEHQLRRESLDRVAAQQKLSVLDDHTMILNGVKVVI